MTEHVPQESLDGGGVEIHQDALDDHDGALGRGNCDPRVWSGKINGLKSEVVPGSPQNLDDSSLGFLCVGVVEFDEAGLWKLPVEAEREGVEACADLNDLRGTGVELAADDAFDCLFAQGMMEGEARDHEALVEADETTEPTASEEVCEAPMAGELKGGFDELQRIRWHESGGRRG